MRTKKVQKTPFQQKLSEKLEASSERMLAKMESANEPATVETVKPGRKAKSSTRTDKQREYDRRYQAKRRAAKQAEKEQAKTAHDETTLAEKQVAQTEPLMSIDDFYTLDNITKADLDYYRKECYRKDCEIENLKMRIAYLETVTYALAKKLEA